ncbi:MAG: hydantoinase/oxoprolinase family protein [Thermoplasmataceae archaeon]|jgi:N-methylhydantoinase A
MGSRSEDGVIVSVDIGGTFTDIIVSRNGMIVQNIKVPTTPTAPEKGAMNGIELAGIDHIDDLTHATTIGTNTLLGQYGLEVPKVSLVTTKGFKDIIEIGRQNRPSLYDLNFQRPRVIVPRELRFELEERTDVNGNIITKPSKEGILKILSEIKAKSPQSIAISFLNSFINDSNEIEVSNYIKKEFEFVTISSEVAPEPREFERTSTAVINSALKPVFRSYISRFMENLRDYHISSISIMSNSGGLISPEETMNRPVSVIESGPAAGVIASAEFAKAIGIRDVISFDMGGTTAKAGAIRNGQIEITREYEVGGSSHHGRIVKGRGYPVRYPFIDLAEVSAGGGTIIWKDDGGAINIGPMSAGAEPGPICYDRGGKSPTITDANLVLGIIRENISGGTFKLRKDLSMKALEELGDPFDVSSKAVSLANLEMARAIRIVTVERGLDPASFTLMGFGGAGPQHAFTIANEMGIRSVVIPPSPGLFSALGLLLSDWKYEARKAFPKDLNKDFNELKERLRNEFGCNDYELFADCMYRGQGSEITVPVSVINRDEIIMSFKKIHEETFGFTLSRDVEIFTIRVFGKIDRNKPSLKFEIHSKGVPSVRLVHTSSGDIEYPVYFRGSLLQGAEIKGPAIIHEESTTTLVPDGWKVRTGKYSELLGVKL